MRYLATAVLALGAFLPSAGAQEMQSAAERMTSLPEPLQEFAMGCLPTLNESKEQAWERFDSDTSMLAYTPERAEPFLVGMSGKAWGFRRQESNYVIVVADNKTCMVYAAEAKQEGLLSSFETLLDTVFPTVRREDIGSPIPDSDQTASKVYVLHLVGQPLIGATVTTDTQYNFAARIVLVPPRPPQG